MAEYIEREALQAALMRKRCGVANQRYTEGWNDCLLRVKSMVSKAPAADVAPVGWISVKDRLPEPETEVLAVYVRNGYRLICPVIYETGTTLDCEVTHWMPLPEPPEEVQENE